MNAIETRSCLNCSREIAGNFCPDCGQKANMHRITFGHFVAHDLLHGMFHLERGIVFTLKDALVRPGKAALDYISGKRIAYYNVFYLSLILIGLAIVLYHFGVPETALKGDDPGSQKVVDVMTGNAKLVVLCFVPLLAINARVLFWKMKLNLAEHFIVAGFTFVGMLLLTDVTLAINAIAEATTRGLLANWALFILSLLALLFPFWAYANLSLKSHSVIGWFWRMVLLYGLLVTEIFFLIALVVWIITGDTEVSIN